MLTKTTDQPHGCSLLAPVYLSRILHIVTLAVFFLKKKISPSGHVSRVCLSVTAGKCQARYEERKLVTLGLVSYTALESSVDVEKNIVASIRRACNSMDFELSWHRL